MRYGAKGANMVKTILCGDYGWYAEVYTDSDGGSGLGDNPRIGTWYGTWEACVALDPREVTLYLMDSAEQPDAFDLACERRHD